MITWRRLALGGVGLVLLGIAGAVLVAYSGFYSVAASRGHPAWLNWFLETGMRRSVEFHSGGAPMPDLDEEGLAQLGGAHFQGGCASCHGGPGEPVNPVYDHMLPSPPKLEDHADDWSEQELFWIIRHGLQYAGMPGWSGEGRDDEVWSLVAFVRTLPEMSEEEYERLVRGNAEPRPLGIGGGGGGITGAQLAPLSSCDRCHDTPEAPPVSGYVPRLAGQPRAYLERSLREYYADRRQSGIMEPVAAELEEEDIPLLADHYAGMSSPAYTPASPPVGDAARGSEIARNGYARGRIPACDSCHGGAGLDGYPRLAGQPAAYLSSQLTLWQKGGRRQTPQAELMGMIAQRLETQQIEDLAAYYASLEPGRANDAADDDGPEAGQ